MEDALESTRATADAALGGKAAIKRSPHRETTQNRAVAGIRFEGRVALEHAAVRCLVPRSGAFAHRRQGLKHSWQQLRQMVGNKPVTCAARCLAVQPGTGGGCL